MTSVQIEIYPDRSALVARSRTLVKERIQTAIAAKGSCSIALAGGSTPKPLYEGLATEDLPWSKLHIFWGDERYVTLNDPNSNAGMAKAAWLDQVSIPKDHVHITPTHFEDPAEAAAAYEKTILQTFGSDRPEFDIILLGMGDDGHTASLFPHTEALNVRDRLVTVGEKAGEPRITFTIPLINQSRCVIFLVSGSNKQMALSQVFAKEADNTTFPSRHIQPQGELWWLLDADAGEVIQSLPNVQVL
ncbi:6-phosphogluconolactonase [Oscillatoria sp. CS-180]|uniref:6-phosphogluconolactonase n=1 Tax=Oscillatoria sp. CS-180 TaxID=3021720 RepID=UPI00232CF097|nr:6-phosphogluconolactonase [Oscillatoria sp. CS-180]MDB9528020.1 6-phosphogluconolactonase [Oscillatoria sp. CS-180]